MQFEGEYRGRESNSKKKLPQTDEYFHVMTKYLSVTMSIGQDVGVTAITTNSVSLATPGLKGYNIEDQRFIHQENAMEDLSRIRETEYKIENFFRDRWSPRAMSGETISKMDLMSLFEAARWAPSSYNNQPWRFLYAFRDTQWWSTYFNLLVEFNQSWAKNAAALVVMVSKKTFDNGEPSLTHSFDAGSAWGQLALQASIKNLVAHGMQGFDYDKAREVLHIPSDYQVEAMCAIGKLGKKEDLPEAMRSKETPSLRKRVVEIALEGTFAAK